MQKLNPLSTNHVQIVATLGPSSSSQEMIKSLFFAGADVFRINFSHIRTDAQRQDAIRQINFIRTLGDKDGRIPAVLIDLQGAKFRVGSFEKAGEESKGRINLTEGQEFILDSQDILGDNSRVKLPHPEVMKSVMPGQQLLLDDGKIILEVKSISPDQSTLVTTVIQGGELSDNKGINIPGALLDLPALTAKDISDLEFIAPYLRAYDTIAQSFVQTASDVQELKDRAKALDCQANIMAKIETIPAATTHLKEISGVADSMMVARGDLKVEVGPENVPLYQIQIVSAAIQAGKPVIVATQMMESMLGNGTPSNADSTDINLAVAQGTSAVMTSAETSTGDYPLQVVQRMRKAIQSAETQAHLYRHAFVGTLSSRTLCGLSFQVALQVIQSFARGILQKLRPQKKIVRPDLPLQP